MATSGKTTRMNNTAAVPRQKNQMPLIVGGAVAFLLIVVIVAVAAGGKGGSSKGKTAGNKKNWTQMINEARRLEQEGINLFVGVQSKAYNGGDLSAKERQEIGATITQSIQKMSGAQKIYSQVESGGGQVPDRGQLMRTLKEARMRVGEFK